MFATRQLDEEIQIHFERKIVHKLQRKEETRIKSEDIVQDVTIKMQTYLEARQSKI